MKDFQQIMGNGFTMPHLSGNPDPRKEAKYEPLFGFPNGRKPRLMVASVDEMDSVQLEPQFRDYCAHKLIKLRACKNRQWIFAGSSACRHYRHAYEECLYQE